MRWECFSHSKEKTDPFLVEFTESLPGDICLINNENIKEIEFTYLPSDKRFVFEEFTSINKATLACGHEFHAFSLIYHMFRNTMSCPICRLGCTNSNLSVKSFPSCKNIKFLHDQIDFLKKEEHENEILDETRDLLESFQSEFSVNSLSRDIISLSPVLNFYAYHGVRASNILL